MVVGGFAQDTHRNELKPWVERLRQQLDPDSEGQLDDGYPRYLYGSVLCFRFRCPGSAAWARRQWAAIWAAAEPGLNAGLALWASTERSPAQNQRRYQLMRLKRALSVVLTKHAFTPKSIEFDHVRARLYVNGASVGGLRFADGLPHWTAASLAKLWPDVPAAEWGEALAATADRE